MSAFIVRLGLDRRLNEYHEFLSYQIFCELYLICYSLSFIALSARSPCVFSGFVYVCGFVYICGFVYAFVRKLTNSMM